MSPIGLASDRRRLLGAEPRPDRCRHSRAPARVAVRSRRGAGADRSRPLHDRQGHRLLRAGARRSGGRRRGDRDTRRHPLRPGPRRPRGGQARAGREAAHRIGRRSGEAGRLGRAIRAGADVRSHLLLHASGAADPRAHPWRARSANVQFVDSVRINLGLVQPDVDVLWDLAPHDLSILDFVLPEDRDAGRGGGPHRRPDRQRARLPGLPVGVAVQRARSPTCTSTGSAPRRSAPLSSAARAAPSSGTT